MKVTLGFSMSSWDQDVLQYGQFSNECVEDEQQWFTDRSLRNHGVEESGNRVAYI